MPVQAGAGNIRQGLPDLLDRAGFVEQQILKDPLPHGIHDDLRQFHMVLSPFIVLRFHYILIFENVNRFFIPGQKRPGYRNE